MPLDVLLQALPAVPIDPVNVNSISNLSIDLNVVFKIILKNVLHHFCDVHFSKKCMIFHVIPTKLQRIL